MKYAATIKDKETNNKMIIQEVGDSINFSIDYKSVTLSKTQLQEILKKISEPLPQLCRHD